MYNTIETAIMMTVTAAVSCKIKRLKVKHGIHMLRLHN
jgi:hypothetical protein